jgi:hypothetical protein
MRRRDALKSMAALGAAVTAPEALAAQQAAARRPEPAPGEDAPPSALPLTLPEAAAEPALHFLTPEEMAALKRLAETIVPRTRTPGALEAGAAEFLDFYLSQSDRERQNVYREGLARLNAEARRRFRAPFAELGVSQIDELLAPLRQPWTPAAPDSLAAFLRVSKDDLLRATVNSRTWAAAAEGRQRTSGATYWYPVE